MKISRFIYLELLSTTRNKAMIKTYVKFSDKDKELATEITDVKILEDESGKYIIFYNKKYYIKDIR